MADVTIRVLPLAAAWETIGVDRLAGVWPENVQVAADRWGSSSASFDLHRRADAAWPAITAFTPVDIDIDGVKCWSGRVRETPVRDGTDSAMSVVCEGWQYHLDDDVFARLYIHSDLSAWVDTRSLPGTSLTQFTAVGKVNTGTRPTIGWGKGDQVANLDHVGVTLDTGPTSGGARRALITVTTINAFDQTIVIRGHSDEQPSGGDYEDGYVNATLGTIAPGPSILEAAFTRQWRYVTLLVYQDGASTTYTGDMQVIVQEALIARDSSYTSSVASLLTADDVIDDAITQGARLLSPRRDGLTATTFTLPALAFQDARTTRDIIDAANAWHNYLTAVDVDARVVFKPLPAAPSIEVGAWSATELQDASANSGGDMYNRVLVEYQSAEGIARRVSRSSAEVAALAPLRQYTATTTSVTNPSFATNTTGWSLSPHVSGWGFTLARDTTTFDTSPAALSVTQPGTPVNNMRSWPGQLRGDLSGTFVRGVTYELTVRTRSIDTLFLAFGSEPQDTGARVTIPPSGTSWRTSTATWTPRETYDASTDATVFIQLSARSPSDVQTWWVDTLSLREVRAGLLDRRGFVRTTRMQVSTALPDDDAAAVQLADTWLAANATVPFRGSVTLQGHALRHITGGHVVDLHRLLLMPRDLIRFSDRGDPDTGAHGRDGRIASVTYTPATDTAQVEIDNTRSNFEVLLARLAVISGS